VKHALYTRLFLLLAVVLFFCPNLVQAQNTLSINGQAVFLYAFTGGPAVQQTLAVASTPAAAVPFTTAFSNASWLTVTPTTATTPVTLTLTANPSGLNAGVYSTFVVFNFSGGSAFVTVVLTVNNANTPLAATPVNLAFGYQPGNPLPPAQALNVTAPAGVLFSASSPGSPWLLLGQTGASITVQVNPSAVSPGQTYVGGITLTPSNGQSPLWVPVIFSYFPAAQLSAAPGSLTFNYQIGATNNVVQKTISVTPSNATVSATATVAGGTSQWLAVSPTSGVGPFAVSVLPTGLPAGTYQGSIAISASGTNSVTVPVTLNVSAQPLLDLSTTSLSYTYQVGGSIPPNQNVTPTSTTPGLPYTVAASSQGNWLNVNVANAVTPSPVSVSVTPVGLPAGTYTGTISFNAVGAANNPQTVTVTLTVTNNPSFTATPNPIVFNYQVGQALPAAQTVSVASGGTPLGFTISSTGTANNVNWLLTGTASGTTTPATFTVGVNPTGLPPGVYSGSVSLTSTGGTAQLTIPVTLNVSNVALLNLPTSISFTSVVITQPGQSGPSQTITVTSTGEAVTYSVTASTTTPANTNWLVVGATSGPASSATPSSFIVAVNPLGLAPGTYQGSLLVHSTNGNPDVTIPVTLTITSGNLTVSPATLNFTQAAGGLAPAAQMVNVGSSGVALSFSALTTVTTTTNWLSVAPASGTTPGTIAVSVNGASLQPGTYAGTINIASATAGNSPQTVTVNLTVGQAQNLSVTPTSLTFSSQSGAPAPASQTIGVTASTGTLSFTAAASTTGSGGTWLSVTPTTGNAAQTATNLTVSVNPQGLNAGTYTGTVVVTGQGASNGPQTVNVTYTIAAIPTPAITKIQNAASSVIGPVAPGEIVSIFGSNLGPSTPANAIITGGFYATTVSDTQVLFDNIPAPLWYVSATQINAIVPYEITGRASTAMQVLYKNTPSATLNLQVTATSPGVFGTYNADGSINGAAQPAQRGMAIVLVATGEGVTNPQGVTGQIIPADVNQVKRPIAPVSLTIGGVAVQPFYYGSIPGAVSGAFQVNAFVPDNAPSGGAVPVVLTIGSASTTTTIVVQ
jgi:uncharacterized protein (TIGR03437 family)